MVKKRHPLIKEVSVHLLSNDLDDKGGDAKRVGLTGGREFVLFIPPRRLQVYLSWLVVQNSAEITTLRLHKRLQFSLQ